MLQGLSISIVLTAVVGNCSRAERTREIERGRCPSTMAHRTEGPDIGPANDLLWKAYCLQLDRLWAEYRAAGSTPASFRHYQSAAAQAKRRYVYGDSVSLLTKA